MTDLRQRNSAGADWLDRLARYLSREDRFTTDSTIPDGVSTVDGLRVAADELEEARALLVRARMYLVDKDGYAVGNARSLVHRINGYLTGARP